MGKPASKPPNIERLVVVWKAAHLAAKPLELALVIARKAVTAAIVASGKGLAATTLGTIPLQTKTVVDWKSLAEKLLAPATIEANLPAFTRQSEPFICAPRGWTEEAKT